MACEYVKRSMLVHLEGSWGCLCPVRVNHGVWCRCWCWCSPLSALPAGYRVKDASGHGHDLLMAEKPRWQVVRWLSTCGNGAVEGAEECDDGAPKDGDGCDSHCRIESGWECSGSPSVCKHTGGCWAALLWCMLV